MMSLLGRLNRAGLLTVLTGPVMNWNLQPIMDEILFIFASTKMAC